QVDRTQLQSPSDELYEGLPGDVLTMPRVRPEELPSLLTASTNDKSLNLPGRGGASGDEYSPSLSLPLAVPARSPSDTPLDGFTSAGDQSARDIASRTMPRQPRVARGHPRDPGRSARTASPPESLCGCAFALRALLPVLRKIWTTGAVWDGCVSEWDWQSWRLTYGHAGRPGICAWTWRRVEHRSLGRRIPALTTRGGPSGTRVVAGSWRGRSCGPEPG